MAGRFPIPFPDERFSITVFAEKNVIAQRFGFLRSTHFNQSTRTGQGRYVIVPRDELTG
jgi:hypothetical protein